MAVQNSGSVRPPGSATGAASGGGGGKRKILTNCQVIDCLSSSSNAPRYHARSVAWNRSGSLLAVGCSDATIRLWNPVQQPSTELTSSTCKDVGSITAQGGPIIAATFHPTADHLLGTCSVAGSLRLWDVRGSNTLAIVSSNPTCVGSVTISSAVSSPIVVAVEWNPVQTHIIAVATHDGSVFIYDTRKLSNASSTTSKGSLTSPASSALLRHVQLEANDRMESCLFDRASGGQYLLTGVTNRDQNSGMGCVKICQWDTEDMKEDENAKKRRTWCSFPAHAGPIFAIAANSSGTQLATGGADAVVGVWDVPTMTCCTALSSRTKYIRSLSFAADDSMLAIATEEDVIELVDCSSSASTVRIGLASLSSGGSGRHRTGGAEDIAFHPSSQYLLACARISDPSVGTYSTASPVSLVKLTTS
jgi:WD40 repeat protein